MPNELKNVRATFISLVKKGANKQEFQIFKSADYDPEGGTKLGGKGAVQKQDQAPVQDPKPEEVTKTESPVEAPIEKGEDEQAKGLFTLVKKFLSGQKEETVDVKKAAQYQTFAERISSFRKNVWNAFDQLWYVVDDILYYEKEDRLEALNQAVEEFKVYINKLASEVDITKSENRQPVSFSEAGLNIMKGMVDSLDKMTQAGGNNIEKGAESEMTREELKAELEPINKSIEGLTQKLESMSTGVADVREKVEKTEEKVAKAEQKVEETEAKVEKKADEGVKEILADIKKSIDGLDTRITSMEEARGIKKSADEKDPVEKSADDWAGVLPGLG